MIQSQKAKEEKDLIDSNSKTGISQKSGLEKEFVKEFDGLVNNHIAEECRLLFIRTIKSKCQSDFAIV